MYSSTISISTLRATTKGAIIPSPNSGNSRLILEAYA